MGSGTKNMGMVNAQQIEQTTRMAFLHPNYSSIKIEIELMPTPRYIPEAKSDCATPLSFGMVKSLNKLTLSGTQAPIVNAKATLAIKIAVKLSANDSRNVQPVQMTFMETQSHLRGYLSTRIPNTKFPRPFVAVKTEPTMMAT